MTKEVHIALNTMGVSSGARTVYPSGHVSYLWVFLWIPCCSNFNCKS